jgi:aspartate-semialdehyde dehydrogenase
LQEVETIVVRELERCSAELAARTALRLLQLPVFHGVGVSIWAEFDRVPATAAIEEIFRGSWVQVRSQQEGVPAVSDAVGQDDILLARVMPDRTHPGAFWFWAVADNLRLAVRNAVALAEDIVA